MQLWRLCRQPHAKRAFDGEGARRFGGRWNRRGDALAYTSPTLSLAALELFVNLKLDEVPDDLVAIPAILPDSVSVEQWHIESLPSNWKDFAPPQVLRDLGSEWIRSLRTAVLLVPSVVIPAEFNVLLNPAHADFARLEVDRPQQFQFDSRMWKR